MCGGNLMWRVAIGRRIASEAIEARMKARTSAPIPAPVAATIAATAAASASGPSTSAAVAASPAASTAAAMAQMTHSGMCQAYVLRGRVERTLYVCHQVGRVLDPGAQPDEAFRDRVSLVPARPALGTRMNPAETGGFGHQLAGLDERLCAGRGF